MYSNVSDNSKGMNLASVLATYGAYIYSSFIFLGHTVSALGALLMAISAGLLLKSERGIYLRDPLILLVVAFVIIVFANAIAISRNAGFSFDEQMDGAVDWGKYALLPLIALALRGNVVVIKRCVYLIIAGFIVSVLIGTEYVEVERALSGQRTGFSVSIIQMGMWSSIFFVLMLAMTPIILKTYRYHRAYLVMVVAWAVLVALMFQIMVFTQARGAWLATAVALVFMLLMYIKFNKISKKGMILAAGLLFGLIAMNFQTFYDRVTTESERIAEIASVSGADEIEISGSIGLRFHMIHFSVKRWLERPILGWGPGTYITHHFTVDDFDDELDKEQVTRLGDYKRLHNGYATVISQLGIVGVIFFALIFYFAASRVINAYSRAYVDVDFLIMYLTLLILQLALYLTNSRFTMIEYQLLFGFIIASAYSFQFKRSQ